MAVISKNAINGILIMFIECPKVLHFSEGENDKQQEVAIFTGNF
jgi:hypothetical protein